jgi:hypothetical protein
MNQHTTSDRTSMARELEAFCPTCPSAEEVTAQLEQLGFRLVFSMPAQPSHDSLPPLPAQYHYRHASGAEAIYLAGQDSPLHTGALSLPFHESRFWLSRGGSHAEAFQLTLSTLTVRWRFQWQEAHEACDHRDETNDAQEVA